jgi:hypothetical protein
MRCVDEIADAKVSPGERSGKPFATSSDAAFNISNPLNRTPASFDDTLRQLATLARLQGWPKMHSEITRRIMQAAHPVLHVRFHLRCHRDSCRAGRGAKRGVFAAGLRYLLLVSVLAMQDTDAQELEPRAYSAAPAGTNFLVASYARLDGQVLTDPSLPVTDIHAVINTFGLGYVRVVDLAGRSASLGLVVPYASGNVSGKVFDASNQVYRAGLGDMRLRFAIDLLGGPALTPEEFARRTPQTIVGASLTVVAPTGQYVPGRLINIGANRWAFKPELGISQPIGNWFAEMALGVWLFTDNTEFLGNAHRSQAPLPVLQLHGGYTFRPGLWLAGDVGFYSGGTTTVNGVANDDRQNNVRYGLTLSVPITRNWSAKLAVSKGLIVRAGGDYKAISLAVQYRWLDH